MIWIANAGGVSPPVGTAVSDGSTFVAGTVPIAKDTTGTNFTGTATLTITSTNASFKGTVFVDNLVATNGITLGSGSTNLSVTGNVLANGGVFTNGVTVGTLNKVTITPPATGSTLTIADGKTATINNSLTLAGADGTTQTFQGSDTIVGRSTTDTLANKTLTAPILGTATGTQLTLSGSLLANDVNSTGSGEGVMSLTNAAGTHVYREAPNASMTGEVFHRKIPAAATGYYKGTASAVTNEVDSIVATISTTDLNGTLAAAQFPALTGPIKTTAGALATTLDFGGSVPTDAESAGVLQFLSDSATATAIALKGPDGSGTDKVGGAFIVRGGQGTGTGRGGDIKGQSSPSSTTGSSANSYADRFFFSAKHVVLTEATATTFVNITCASGKSIAGEISASVNADDGTNFQMQENHLKFAAVNKAGTITATIDTVAGTVATSSGTLTPVTFTIVANGASVDIKVAATSSLTQTTLNCEWAILSLNGNGAAAVTAQ